MKKWKNIVYLDSDCIVRYPLDSLTRIEGLAAVPENGGGTLREQFIKEPVNSLDRALLDSLQKNYNLSLKSFNAGVLAYSSDIIGKKTFSSLNRLLQKYEKISKYGDQGVQNLYFCDKWIPLAMIYNTFPLYVHDTYGLPFRHISPVIIHFADKGDSSKPWHKNNHFYDEWLNNLRLFPLINSKRILSVNRWKAGMKLLLYSLFINLMKYLRFPVRYFSN